MKCPSCGVDNDRVIDSRASQDGFAIRRRRECLACQARYNTYERVDEAIKCPSCHEDSNRVVETEISEGGFAVRRHRECLSCRRQYTTFERSEERSIKVIEAAKEAIGYREIAPDPDVVKISVIGVGMRSHAGVAQRMFKTLAEKGINIQVISLISRASSWRTG